MRFFDYLGKLLGIKPKGAKFRVGDIVIYEDKNYFVTKIDFFSFGEVGWFYSLKSVNRADSPVYRVDERKLR